MSEVLIGLGGFLAGMLVTWLWVRWKAKTKHTTKLDQFNDALVPVLDNLNGYLAQVGVWAGEETPDALEELLKAAEDITTIYDLDHLIEQYYTHLPAVVLEKGKDLVCHCLLLSREPTMVHSETSLVEFFKFRQTVREAQANQANLKGLYSSYQAQN